MQARNVWLSLLKFFVFNSVLSTFCVLPTFFSFFVFPYSLYKIDYQTYTFLHFVFVSIPLIACIRMGNFECWTYNYFWLNRHIYENISRKFLIFFNFSTKSIPRFYSAQLSLQRSHCGIIPTQLIFKLATRTSKQI